MRFAAASACSAAVRPRLVAPLTPPGLSELTVTPYGASRTARLRVTPWTECLDAKYEDGSQSDG